MKKLLMLVTFLLLLSACTFHQSTLSSNQSSNNHSLIDNIPCESMEELSYHVHAHLNIFIEGKQVNLPAQIGIPNGECVYWLHTHDLSGVIHIEAPEKRTFQLGTLFDIWGQPLSAIQVASYTTDSIHTFTFYVNGQEYTGDPRQIPLEAHTNIDIELGPPYPTPQPYQYQSGL